MSSNPEKRHSLERSLQVALGGLVLLAMLALALTGIVAVRDLAKDYVTTRLEHDAEALVAMLEPREKRFLHAVPPIYNQPYSGHYFIIRFDDGSLLRSRSLWDTVFSVEQTDPGENSIDMVDGPQEQQLLMRTATYRKQQQAFTLAIAEDIGTFRTMMQWLLWLAIGVVIITLLLFLLIQKHLLRRGFRRLDLVREDVRSIARGEKESLRTDVPTEITPLVTDFNQLLTGWRGYLARSRHAAGNLAHALKTPLSLILQQGRKHDDQYLVKQAERMRDLIDRELNRARIAGSALAGRRFRPATDIAELADVIRQLHRDRQLDLQLVIDAEDQLPLDQQDMLELVGNLLENAAKWARHRIRLTLGTGDGMRLVIEDDGPGINRDSRSLILTRGTRLDESEEGHGIGLSIVQEIIELYGGSIDLGESDELGGLRVTVELPLPG
ncbi:MAG: sensor histidine kinase [Chromatiales bacterium]|jgi:signal transduction histidine kinase